MGVVSQIPFRRVGLHLPERKRRPEHRGASRFENGLLAVVDAGPGVWFKVEEENVYPHATRAALKDAARTRNIEVHTEVIDDGEGARLYVSLRHPLDGEEVADD